jgi:hypothetical protein
MAVVELLGVVTGFFLSFAAAGSQASVGVFAPGHLDGGG